LRYKAELDKLRKEIGQSGSEETLYQGYLKSGLTVTQNLTQLYLKGNTGQKKEILGSIFPKKTKIDEKNCRTAKVNEALALILATDKGFKKIKTGQLFKNIELPGYVDKSGHISNQFIEELKALASLFV
jgi:hypothetical protein